jgi:acetolactate synthase I/II/III large subunit
MNPAQICETLVGAIAAAGGDTVFGMPGGGNNLAFIGAAESAGLRFVLAHAETNAAIMAAVYADLTRRPTACVVTRGPGAASAVNGVANALLDRQPVIVVADAVGSESYERIAHQRLDQLQLFAPVTKWAATLGAEATEETAAAAVAVSMRAPSGPVFLNFDPHGTASPLPAVPPVGATTLPENVLEDVRSSERPLVLLGTGARVVADSVREALDGTGVPVLTTYRAKGVVPESSSEFAGILTGATTEAPLLEAADLIVMIGVDTVELIPSAWPYSAPVLSLAAWAEGSPYLSIQDEVIGDLTALVCGLRDAFVRANWPAGAVSDHRRSELERLVGGPAADGGIAAHAVIQRARVAALPGTVATVDAGAHMLPAMELWTAENADEILISSGLATMGFSVPAAVGAAFARPDRRVVAFIGDGGLAMCLGEIETLARYRLNVTVVVFNDSRLSLIAIKAKGEGNGGENAIAFSAVDFAEVARAHGIAGYTAGTEGELDEALGKALATDGPSLVDAKVDPSAYPHILNSIRGQR